MKRIFACFLLFVVFLTHLAAAQMKSKIIGNWKETALMIDGKPVDKSALLPKEVRGLPVTPGVTLLEFKLKGTTLRIVRSFMFARPGGILMPLRSEEQSFDLTKPNVVSIIAGGPKYKATVELTEQSLTIIYSDKDTDKLVSKHTWVVDEKGKTLTSQIDTPGSKSCTANTETRPNVPNQTPTANVSEDNCIETSRITTLFARD